MNICGQEAARSGQSGCRGSEHGHRNEVALPKASTRFDFVSGSCVSTELTLSHSYNPAFPDTIDALFHQRLLAWYDQHARDLPWRARPGQECRRDPYPVWVSEIMLQQTRVAAVMAHYHEFLRRFPAVERLAAAREPSVLAAWSGLGYYRRARMLHAAAKFVVRELDGKFPTTAEGWRALPGIGRYTAAAIASISFGEAVAVVDGNVERVLQRLAGRRLPASELWRAAQGLLQQGPLGHGALEHAFSIDDLRRGNPPGDFNQAMMELGATVCTPRAPACGACPIVELCATRGELAGTAKVARQKKREIDYALDYRTVGRVEAVFLVRRPEDARLMAGMWELPQVVRSGVDAGKQQVPPARFAGRRNDRSRTSRNDNSRNNGAVTGSKAEICFKLKHSITVTDYTVRVWRRTAPDRIAPDQVVLDRVTSNGGAGEWIAVRRLQKLAMTGLARKILRRAGLLKSESAVS